MFGNHNASPGDLYLYNDWHVSKVYFEIRRGLTKFADPKHLFMQDYISLRIDATPCDTDTTDLLAAFLGDIGFESFVPDDKGLTAYIQDSIYKPEDIRDALADFPINCDLSLSTQLVKGQNWNSEWEKHYFKPITVGNECVVHSTFHTDVPQARYDIVIDPKMAFGTGHHATTSQMIRLILDTDLTGKSVIDMGTGTGILSILCCMKGASRVTGIEIDPYACENAVENVALNNADAEMITGDASALSSLKPVDFFLANINRNVITGDIEKYSSRLKRGGAMLLSGFYTEDIPVVEEAASKAGLKLELSTQQDNWVALRLVKIN